MKKNSTSIVRMIKHVTMFVFILASLTERAFAQAPYCSVIHSATLCPMYNMYIGAFRVQQGSTILFDKANDGCNQAAAPNYTLMSTTPSFTLIAGSTYSLSFNTGNIYTVHIAVWLDINGDYDFADAGEFLSNGWADILSDGTLQSRMFTLGCAGIKTGATRMRVRSNNSGSPVWNAGGSCSNVNFGETEDYMINLALPSTLAAGFFMPATAYKDSPVKMTNNNQTGYISHKWDVNDDGSIEYTTTNASHIFTTAGTKCVRLTSRNCLGSDSVLHCINIIAPTAKPVVDFKSDTNEVEHYGIVNLFDLSTNGPTYWAWYLYDPADSAASRADVEFYNLNLVGNDPYKNTNPMVFFNKIGNYTVCLQTANSKGPSSLLCKPNYVKVTPFKDKILGAGTVQPIDELSGCILDDGGRTGPYSNDRKDYATIIPSGTNKITLKFKQFRVDFGDSLKVYDGTNNSGKPIHTGKGFTLGNTPKSPLIATSGAMYLFFSTNSSGVDSGIIACWTAETSGISVFDKDKTFNVYPNPSNGNINISYNFTTPGLIDLEVYNCTGSLVAQVNAIYGQNGVQTIDLSDEASGLYSIRMRVNGRQISRKISIRR